MIHNTFAAPSTVRTRAVNDSARISQSSLSTGGAGSSPIWGAPCWFIDSCLSGYNDLKTAWATVVYRAECRTKIQCAFTGGGGSSPYHGGVLIHHLDIYSGKIAVHSDRAILVGQKLVAYSAVPYTMSLEMYI